MAEAIYVLCFLTSLAAALLLWRGWLRSRTRLLLWSSVCFVGMSLNNAILFCDRVVFPEVDLSLPRQLTALVGLCFLLYGLVWDSR